MRRESRWRQDDLLRWIYYARHALALAWGVTAGLLQREGVWVLLAFAVASLALPPLLLKGYLRVRYREYPEEAAWQFLAEAAWVSTLFFLLIWMVSLSITRVSA